MEKELIGYNCEVCHGANINEDASTIVHTCEGVLIPVYEDTPPETIESAVSRFDKLFPPFDDIQIQMMPDFTIEDKAKRQTQLLAISQHNQKLKMIKEFWLTELTRAREEGRNETPANMRPHKRDCCELFNGCTCVGCECWEINREIVEAHLPKEEKGISR